MDRSRREEDAGAAIKLRTAARQAEELKAELARVKSEAAEKARQLLRHRDKVSYISRLSNNWQGFLQPTRERVCDRHWVCFSLGLFFTRSYAPHAVHNRGNLVLVGCATFVASHMMVPHDGPSFRRYASSILNLHCLFPACLVSASPALE